MTYRNGIKHGYRSGLEETIQHQFEDLGLDGEYEQHKISFTEPAKKRKYTPDFWIRGDNKTIIIETKGRFTTEDRKKHEIIKKEHPELDIRFVFQYSKGKIRKGSKTTYADWCDKKGFIYADKTIPLEWFREVGVIE